MSQYYCKDFSNLYYLEVLGAVEAEENTVLVRIAAPSLDVTATW